jgi:DNA-binding GntR family transcriptional regulator
MARSNGDGSARNADRIYGELRERILSLRLQPGSVIDEARLVSDMGMSRTPVREAIIRLVSEGLLRRDGRQTRVSAFEVNELRALFEALTLLSRATNRMAAARRTERRLADIRRAMLEFERQASSGDEIAINEANHEFHLAVAHAADSPFLERAYQDVLVESLRLSRQCFLEGEGPKDARANHLAKIIDDHRALYEAIKRQDSAEADRVADRHIKLFREGLSRQLLGPTRHVSSMNIDDI